MAKEWFRNPTTLIDELKRSGYAQSTPPELPGYDDVRELQRGGQGVVYAAIQRTTRQPVAIKVLYEDALHGDARRRRFEREIEVVATLRHPGIVRVYDGGVADDGRLHYVMERIDGLPLDEYARSRPRDAKGRRALIELFMKVCNAVHFAHQHGVMHRDLKPSNILVDEGGDPHVLDFGIAKVAGPQDPTTATLTGQFIGTLAYASPEQVRADPAQLDLRTDVYSLGVILYELLGGRPPYPGDVPVAELVKSITETTPVPPSAAARATGAPVVDEELDTIVFEALAKDAERRYASAAALAADLARYLSGEPIEAKRDSTWYVFSKQVRRHKVSAGLTLALFVLLVTFGIFMTLEYRRASDEAFKANLAAEKAQQIRFFLEDTLGSVEPTRLGHEVTVREVLDDAVHWVDMLLADQPLVAASLRNTIGGSYRSLGLHSKAEEQLTLALEIRRREWGANHAEVGQSLNSLGLLRLAQDRLPEAERLFREALEMRRALLGVDHFDVSLSLNNLAGLRRKQRQFEEAERLYSDSLRIRLLHREPDHADVAMCRFRLAEVRRDRGELEDAENLFRAALDSRRKSLHREHPDFARSLLGLGRLLMEARRAEEAEQYLREGWEIRRDALPPRHWRTLETAIEVAACWVALERFDDAEQLLRETIRGYEDQTGTAATSRNKAFRLLEEIEAKRAEKQ